MRVDEADLAERILLFDGRQDLLCQTWWRGRLADHAELRHEPRSHVVERSDDVAGLEIFGDPLHFDVTGPSDEDDFKTLACELHGGFVDTADERTRRVDQVFARCLQSAAFSLADAMRRDQDRGRDRHSASLAFRRHAKASLLQLHQDAFVMHQLAVNGDIAGLRDVCRGLNGVAHTEAHAERSRAKDFHRLAS